MFLEEVERYEEELDEIRTERKEAKKLEILKTLAEKRSKEKIAKGKCYCNDFSYIGKRARSHITLSAKGGGFFLNRSRKGPGEIFQEQKTSLKNFVSELNYCVLKFMCNYIVNLNLE